MPPTVQAVLDWSSPPWVSHWPTSACFLFYWREPSDVRAAMTPAPTMQPGFPSRTYLAERYATRTGADLSDLSSWVALAHFKSAVIAQGIAARVQAGSMAGQQFGDIGAEVDRIAAEGLALLTGRADPAVTRRPPGVYRRSARRRRRVHEASGYPFRWPDDPGWQLAGTQPATWIDPDGSTPTICCYVAPLPRGKPGRPLVPIDPERAVVPAPPTGRTVGRPARRPSLYSPSLGNRYASSVHGLHAAPGTPGRIAQW